MVAVCSVAYLNNTTVFLTTVQDNHLMTDRQAKINCHTKNLPILLSIEGHSIERQRPRYSFLSIGDNLFYEAGMAGNDASKTYAHQ